LPQLKLFLGEMVVMMCDGFMKYKKPA